MVEVLKQPQFQPMPVEKQIVIIYAVSNGYLDGVAPSDVRQWERDYHEFLDARHPEVLQTIRKRKALDDQLRTDLKAATEEFSQIE